jgi:glutamyl-tRNA synthetase
MFDEYFTGDLEYQWQKITDKEEIKKILTTYLDKYSESDDKETWFNKVKEVTEELGYCTDMKAYRENPDAYPGSVADVSTVIRVALTTSSQTPDLYELLRLIGKDRIKDRFSKFM